MKHHDYGTVHVELLSMQVEARLFLAYTAIRRALTIHAHLCVWPGLSPAFCHTGPLGVDALDKAMATYTDKARSLQYCKRWPSASEINSSATTSPWMLTCDTYVYLVPKLAKRVSATR
jgi:hypothetical protein